MKSSDFLFQLIKALNKGDRRNFKLFARLQEGDKKYIQLFDAIDKQDEYVESKLLKQFKGERFTRQFSVAKNYLYNFILRTLHIFDKNPESDLRTLVHLVQVLIDKNLFAHAEKLARKASHLADRQERFKEKLELLGFQRTILHRSQRMKEFEFFIGEIERNELETQKKILNLLEYTHLQDQIFLALRKSRLARKPAELESFTEIMQNPLMKDESLALSTRSRLKMFGTLSDCYQYAGKFEQCQIYSEKIVQSYEGHPEILREEKLKYILEVANLSAYHFMLKNFSESINTLEKLQAIPVDCEHESLTVFERFNTISLAMYIETGDVSRGISLIRKLEKDLQNLDGKLRKSYEMYLHLLLAHFWVTAGNPSEALPWINMILNEPKSELRTDIQCFARLLNLVIHFDLGNRDLVTYHVNSAYRFIYKRNRLYKFESCVLKYMKKLAVSDFTEKDIPLLQSFRKELSQIIEDPYESGGLLFFDFLLWIDSKLQNVSMAKLTSSELLVKVEKQKKPPLK